jgi:(S)-mandelate dehydrogenase
LSAPFAIAPTGLNGSFWPKGDALLAKSAAKADIPFMLSTASNMSIEEVARSSDGEKWFQLYVVHQELAKQMVQRALDSGYTTLIVTLDVGVNGYRERDLRNQFGLPLKFSASLVLDGMLHPAWSLRFLANSKPQLANFVSAKTDSLDIQVAIMKRQMDASFNQESLKRIREIWPHQLLVKGIVSAEDAQIAIQCGADGVILSNHGGRQLDCSVSPMETLQDVSRCIQQPILIDSGFRRGSDIVKALCLGADMVCLGRPTLYGLASKGEQLFFHPTILTNIDKNDPIFIDEIFGPVAPIIIFDDIKEAVDIVNSSKYGLAVAIHSKHTAWAYELAKEIKSGMIHINDQTVNNEYHVPFGGMGESGYGGRFGGPANFDEFSQRQWISILDKGIQYPL